MVEFTCWAALHTGDGVELDPAEFPGYERAPYSPHAGAYFRPGAITDWPRPVVYVSAWTAPTGGECVSNPPLQLVHKSWAVDTSKRPFPAPPLPT